jgi:hypothetical protein
VLFHGWRRGRADAGRALPGRCLDPVVVNRALFGGCRGRVEEERVLPGRFRDSVDVDRVLLGFRRDRAYITVELDAHWT